MTADAHIHFFSHRFFELLGAAPERLAALDWELPDPDPVDLARRWIAELDKYQVDRAALIASHPGDVASVLAAKRAYPNRLVAFAMVNPLSGNLPDLIDCACLFPAMHGYW